MFRRVCLYRRGLFIKIGMLLAAVPLMLYPNSARPPSIGLTGGFGEPTCNQFGCHNTFTLNPTSPGGGVTIGAPSSYTPGATVPVTVTIQDNSADRGIWGFQLSARFRNGMPAGRFSIGPNVGIEVSSTGVFYAFHQPAVVRRGVSSFPYTVMWTAPSDASGGDVVFNAAGNAANLNNEPTGDRIYTTQAISAAPTAGPPPRIGAGGIANGAAFQAGAMAPGTIISIFGENMATTTQQATVLPLPIEIAGTRVMVNNVPAPLFFVSPGQINAQVPFEVAGITPVNVVVQVSGQTSAPEPLQIAATSPGIFTVPSVGSGPGAIIDASTFQTIAPLPGGAPARPGQVVAIFCTGLGQTNPPLASGAAGATSEPLNRTVQAATVTIGGQNATVSFSGAAPGFAALYQINAMVPSLPAGDHEVRISIGAQQSRAGVTIRVQP